MNKQIIASILLFAAGNASAVTSSDDFAEVVSATPNFYEYQRAHQDCSKPSQPAAATGDAEHSYVGTVVGAVAGGLLGSQVGKGNGKVAAAAVGAAVGAVVGDRMGNTEPTNNSYPTAQGQCRTIYVTERQESGYLVTYRYNGREYSSVMQREPGRTVRVNVTVTPNNY